MKFTEPTSECSKLKRGNLSHLTQSGSDKPSFTGHGTEQVQYTLHSCSGGSQGTAAEPLKPGGQTLLFQEKLHPEKEHQHLHEMRLPFLTAMLSNLFPTRKNRPGETICERTKCQARTYRVHNVAFSVCISNYPFPTSTPFSRSSINNYALHPRLSALSDMGTVRSGLTY